jgi:hypothetical protein
MPASTLEMMRTALRSATVGEHHLTKRKTLMKASLTLAFALLLICTGTGAALAQTPDGTPPSSETVCDGQAGAAYGLCTAFCEAMDCDSDDPQASQTACDKVGAKFLNITGQAPPCAVPTCPCVGGVPGFSEALNGEFGGLTRCQESVFPEFGIDSVTLTTGDGHTVNSVAGPNNGCSLRPGGTLFLPNDQALACSALLRETAVAAGLTCGPF